MCIPTLAKVLAEPARGIAPVFNFARTLERFKKRGKVIEGDIVAAHNKLFRVGPPTNTEYVSVVPLEAPGEDAQSIHKRALTGYSIQTDGSIYTAARAAGNDANTATAATVLPLKQPSMSINDETNSVLEGEGKRGYSPKEFIENLLKTVKDRSLLHSASVTEQTCGVCGSIQVVPKKHGAVVCTATSKLGSTLSLKSLVLQATQGIGSAQLRCAGCKKKTSP